MDDRQTVRAYYDDLGAREWQRLDSSAHARLVYHLHRHWMAAHVGPGRRMLDAGCGAGRYAVDMARAGARVSLLDLSPTQLALAQGKLAEEGLAERCERALVADICALPDLADASYDTVVCFGGALNYLFAGAAAALGELVRVARPGGTVLVSAMSRWGVLRYVLGNERMDPAAFFGRPDYWLIPQVVETGDLPAHPEVRHPPRHFYTSAELCGLLESAGLEQVQMASAPALFAAFYARLELAEQSAAAWETLLRLEEQATTAPGLLDAGEWVLGKGIVPKESTGA
jgi:SAM-dependent methyltransferase